MLRIRRFSLTVVCDPCRSRTTVNLVERPELAEVEVGSVDFACPRCSRICRYELQPPHQTRKRLLHEQAIGCRGPADYDPKPFVGPFPLLSGHEELIGDLAARRLRLRDSPLCRTDPRSHERTRHCLAPLACRRTLATGKGSAACAPACRAAAAWQATARQLRPAG
jgi:hypothetical protein